MSFMLRSKRLCRIPVQLTLSEFNEFIFEHLPQCTRGPKGKISLFKIFNYILTILYTGCQWISLPIAIDPKTGKPELHYTRIFKIFRHWVKTDVFEKIFENSVVLLHLKGLLDLSILHGETLLRKSEKRLNFPLAIIF